MAWQAETSMPGAVAGDFEPTNQLISLVIIDEGIRGIEIPAMIKCKPSVGNKFVRFQFSKGILDPGKGRDDQDITIAKLEYIGTFDAFVFMLEYHSVE